MSHTAIAIGTGTAEDPAAAGATTRTRAPALATTAIAGGSRLDMPVKGRRLKAGGTTGTTAAVQTRESAGGAAPGSTHHPVHRPTKPTIGMEDTGLGRGAPTTRSRWTTFLIT